MDSFRLWLFRGLVAIAAGVMVISFTMPWWTANLAEVPIEDSIRVYGYGFFHELAGVYLYPDIPLEGYLNPYETPFYQTVLAWVYLAASVGLILFSTWLKGRKGGWLLGGIGLVYIAYATIAAIQVAIGSGNLDISLQGVSFIPPREQYVEVYASLRLGYYLAYAAGGLCIALALFRNRITGKLKPGT